MSMTWVSFLGLLSMVTAGEVTTSTFPPGCVLCGWTEIWDIWDEHGGWCLGTITPCPGVCLTTLACRLDPHMTTFLAKTECVCEDVCESFDPEVWLDQESTGNIVAKTCCRPEDEDCATLTELYYNLHHVDGIRMCDFDDRNCGKSIYPDAGEIFYGLPRIVGGRDARKNEFPYQVRIIIDFWSQGERKSASCGGTLIKYNTVVTTAYCVTIANTDVINVYLGEHDIDDALLPEEYEAYSVTVHENYDGVSENDIALIEIVRVREEFEDWSITPICRPEQGNQYDGALAIVSGWGMINNEHGDDTVASVLQYAPMEIMSDCDCENYWPGFVPGKMCASDGLDMNQRGGCMGDGGGPLAVKDQEGRFRLVGIMWGAGSNSEAKCVDGRPQLFVRITDYLDWIDSHLP